MEFYGGFCRGGGELAVGARQSGQKMQTIVFREPPFDKTGRRSAAGQLAKTGLNQTPRLLVLIYWECAVYQLLS